MMIGEKRLEKRLSLLISRLGGEAIKLTSQFHRGLPDRLVLLPGGKTLFVELKSMGKKPTRLQASTHRELMKLGYDVYVIDSETTLNALIDEIRSTYISTESESVHCQ